jgi:type IV pilus assembly protein PilM
MHMQQSRTHGLVRHSILERWFPAPSFLLPRSIGVDISDASVKWMGLEHDPKGGYRVRTFGSRTIPNGVVVGGVIHDGAALATVLKDVRTASRSRVAHAALPEEQAYVFSMHVPDGTRRDQVLRLVEFEFEGRVPIPPATATYDFDVIKEGTPEGTQIGVTVFPRELADQYASAFEAAGFELGSLEIEARSIGRAIDDGSRDESVTLLVDFGLSRTGFAILKCGVPIFTTTVEFGNEAATRRIKEKFSLSDEDIKTIRNDEGLFAAGEHAGIREEFEKSAIGLAEEIAKYYHFWDTRRDEHGERVTPVGTVTLVGGSANMKGLIDLIASKVQARTQRADIWRHILHTESVLPPIDKRTSLQFGTAAGLSLRGI